MIGDVGCSLVVVGVMIHTVTYERLSHTRCICITLRVFFDEIRSINIST